MQKDSGLLDLRGLHNNSVADLIGIGDFTQFPAFNFIGLGKRRVLAEWKPSHHCVAYLIADQFLALLSGISFNGKPHGFAISWWSWV